MGLYDDLLTDEQPQVKQVVAQKPIKQKQPQGGLYDDLLTEEPTQEPTFADSHPFVASLPEAGKQFGVRAVKSYPEFAKGLNDLVALAGDKTHLQGVSDFGRNNAEFWQNQSDKIQIDPKYQGLKGLSNKATVIPTITGSIGDQATNLLTAAGGGAGGAKMAAQIGAKGLAKAGLITAGTSIPNLAQEGSYLDKIQAFQQINGRIPTAEELAQIQNVAIGEKAINTALETVSDRLLFGKLFPQGTATKSVKGILKNAGQQALTEAGTEAMQESTSIGAEKLLGINQGDNIARLADSAAIGAVTGGGIGLGASAISQPYDAQFPNTVEEQRKNVSAKIMQNGKELYNSAVEALNKPDTFDTLRQLSREGVLSSNNIEQIAPKTAAKQKRSGKKAQNIINNSPDVVAENIGLPNFMAENENLYNVSENGENNITNENTVQNIADEVQKAAPAVPSQAVMERPKQTEKDKRKVAAKERALEKIKEIAPNTVEKQKSTAEIAAEFHRNHKAGDIVKDDDGNVYEFMNNGYIRNVDTEEVSMGDVNKVYENYIPDEKEYRQKTEYKYDKKAKKGVNAQNYVYSQAEVIDAYNEYIKKPTQDNKEKFEDISGQKFDEFYSKEMQDGPKQTVAGLDENGNTALYDVTKITDVKRVEPKKTSKIAPNTVEKQVEKENLIAKAKDLGLKGNLKSMKLETLKNSIQKAETSVDMNKHIYEGWTVADFIENLTPAVEMIMDGKNWNAITAPFKNRHELKKWCMSNQPYYKSYIPDVVNHFAQKYNIKNDYIPTETKNTKTPDNIQKLAPKTVEKQTYKNPASLEGYPREKAMSLIPFDKNNNNSKRVDVSTLEKVDSIENATHHEINTGEFYRRTDNGGTLNGNVEKTDVVRPDISEKQKETGGKTSGISQEEPANGRTSDAVGREYDLSSTDRGGITKEDTEIIDRNYKNQHELNSAIEDYINNGKYKKYPGSVRMPQAIKNWLKKYTGAGGLEKQGAEGKGLLSEFYTPHDIVKKMWDLTSQYVDVKGAKVLEPSVGIGRFIEDAPSSIGEFGQNFDVVEMNPVSATITKILYPNANVQTGEFQEKFINKTNNTPLKNVNAEYDVVIGNPPYGQYSGRYKGLGEGKKFSRLEAYFINRGLDSLKENGVMTFIVPSSFLDGVITVGKQEIGKKCEILDAYRLPENTFDTTSIGTDIIVLRKNTKNGIESDINLGKWFEKHPEKILGSVETRKNRFGKSENYVKGDKNAVGSIDTSVKNIKATEQLSGNSGQLKTEVKNTQNKNKTAAKKNLPTQKANIEYTEYVPENYVSDAEMELFADTKVDGTLPENKYKPNSSVSQYKGKLYNDFNYLQGDIYEKLDALDSENISEEQKEVQRKKLNEVLPEAKTVTEISFNPTSDFIREFSTGVKEEKEHYDWQSRTSKVFEDMPLDKMYLNYAEKLTKSEREDVTISNIREFIYGNKIRIEYRYPSGCYDDKARAEFRKQKSAEILSKIKKSVDKTFNEFVRNELSIEQREKLADEWNRKFNAVYNPDFTQMPMIVKGLNSEFYGKKLELQNVQVEGVNFLTNKGMGLLGFEVGVGKTLTGIIATKQNMDMGRCKRPLILVPKQVKQNWIREINQAFPNIKVNDVDNMSKFKGEISENTLTVATYEALGNIWYGDSIAELTNDIYQVQNDFSRESTKRGQEKTKETAEKMLGEAEKGNKKLFNIQDLGFDHITVDEAHNFKNLFDKAKAEGQEGNTYANIVGGSQSARAARLFLLSQYILKHNSNRNVFMLTATPFNNSPLEVFNMVSFIGKDKLDRMGLYNVYQFMENYADISSDWIVNSKNEVEYKQIVTGFKNASSLRELIKSVMLIRSAEDAGIKRPEKFTKRVVLEPSKKQLELIAAAEEEATTGKKDDGAVLKAINQSRQATLSPDIATNNFEVSAEDFIKNSPKLNYVMGAVETMKKKDSSTSQIIYMPLGVKFLPKIKEYLVNKKVFKNDEVAIIDSGVSDDKISKITDSFNDKEGKVKLVIGTNKIKEGMNLNKNSSVLYVPYMDWNPTDFVQIVGRIWRRGNRYSKIRVVVPLLKNSSDSFMFQKLNEKTDRINNIMDESKEYIDTSELNTAEEKINMISNPEKKVRMFIKVEQQKLQGQKSSLEGRLEMVQSYKNSIKSDESMIKHSEERLEEYQNKLKDVDPEKDKWEYERYQGYVKNYKKDLATYKLSLKKTKERVTRLELDFEGKDSEEIIQSEIQKVEEQIQNVEKFSEKKLEEYTANYEAERKNSKTVSDLISEFESDTERLYGSNTAAKSEDSKAIDVAPKKRYEKTREAAYSVPVITLETQSKKNRKEKSKKEIEKSKNVVDAKKYDKLLKTAISKWSAEINDRRYDVDRVLNSFINHTKMIAKTINVKDKHLREIMPFLRERTDYPEELNRPELKAVWDKVQNTKGLAERLTKLADDVSLKTERFWNEYKAVQANGEYNGDENKIEHYINHEWDLGGKKNKALLTSYFATKSRYAKERKLETYYQGIMGVKGENGEVRKFTPKILDYAELVKIQTDSLIKSTVDKVLADSVKNFKTDSGASLVLPAHKAPNNWVEINHNALNKTVVRPVSTKFGEKIAPDLQNKLGEIGVAIGNRLSKYKGNGQPNSLGKYVKNQPPEIRLQRWFSSKTLAHEVGHALDEVLGLQKDGFINRHRDELIELNKERIEAFEKQGDKSYAERDSELVAELFGVMFNDVESALKYAPSATSEVMGRMTDNEKLAQLLPGNFDWAEAKHVIEEKAVEFFKETVKVHPDIASSLKVVFEPKKEYMEVLGFKPGKTLDNVNAVAKMFNFSLSGFHAWALSESYLGNVGIKGLKDTFNFKKIYNSVKNGNYDIYKDEALAKQAIKDGLQIGATLDVQRGVTETLINNAGKWIENNIPGFGKPFSLLIKGLGKATELNNKALWDVIHNNYKLNAYELLVKNEAEKGSLTDAKRKEITQWVNDSFGGQVWENLGISPSTKKTFSRWLMSPDWLLSSTRQFMGLLSSKRGHQKLNDLSAKSDFWGKAKEISQFFGITSLTDDVEATGMRGRLARQFWGRAAIQSIIYMNVLNALFRAWDKDKHPELYPDKFSAIDYSMLGNSTGSKTCVFIGRNKDGSEKYVRFGKQFREVPEMIEDPIKKIGGKFAPLPQTTATIFTGRSMSGFENKEMSEAQGWGRVGVAAKQGAETFLPFSVGSAINKGADYSVFDLVATTSKGMTKYKAGKSFTEAYKHGNKPERIKDIEKSMVRNGFSQKDIKTIRNRAKGQYTKQFKDGYITALESGDKSKVIKITEDMSRKNVSPIDQRKIYTKALSEYYKNRGIK